jgi:hypothetical protein
MRTNIPNRRISALTGMGILFLAFAVFGWGIKYKLSLYDAPGSLLAHIPHAKLLSQKERPVTDSVVDSVPAASPLPQSSIFNPAILAVGLMLALHLAVALRSVTIMVDDSRQQRSTNSSFFSFRPPPVSA